MIVVLYDIEEVGYTYDNLDETVIVNNNQYNSIEPLDIRKWDFIPSKGSLVDIDSIGYKIVTFEQCQMIGENGEFIFYKCYLYCTSNYSNTQYEESLYKKLNSYFRKNKIEKLLD